MFICFWNAHGFNYLTSAWVVHGNYRLEYSCVAKAGSPSHEHLTQIYVERSAWVVHGNYRLEYSCASKAGSPFHEHLTQICGKKLFNLKVT